jgi:hypothetical protein
VHTGTHRSVAEKNMSNAYDIVHDARCDGEEAMFENMTTEDRVRDACKVLGMTALGTGLGCLMVFLKWYFQVEL